MAIIIEFSTGALREVKTEKEKIRHIVEKEMQFFWILVEEKVFEKCIFKSIACSRCSSVHISLSLRQVEVGEKM